MNFNPVERSLFLDKAITNEYAKEELGRLMRHRSKLMANNWSVPLSLNEKILKYKTQLGLV
jgi:hypothetical protein